MMDVMLLTTMVGNMITQARAGNWKDALGIAMDIIKQLPTPSATARFASPAKAQAFAACDGKSEDELLDELDALCKQHATLPAHAQASPITGQLIDTVLPILTALLKKWLIG